jgi:hypothetical protein
MAEALKPVPTGTGSIFFELDRFEFKDGDRIALCGRWFGVRGRRFVRPTLTLSSNDEQWRLLADLEHKPWSAEDGEHWEAVFPWQDGNAKVLEAELAVASGITLNLRAPDGAARTASRRGRAPRSRAGRASVKGPERIAVRTRRRSSASAKQQPEADPESALRRRVEALRGELSQARAEIERLERELHGSEEARLEASAALARRDAAINKLDHAAAERDEAIRAREAANKQHGSAVRERREALRARDAVLIERDAAFIERDRAIAEKDAALGTRDRGIAERDQAIAERDALAQTNERLQVELDEALSTRAAALVMRNATRAPALSRGHSLWSRQDAVWLPRALAIFVLVVAAVAFAVVLRIF